MCWPDLVSMGGDCHTLPIAILYALHPPTSPHIAGVNQCFCFFSNRGFTPFPLPRTEIQAFTLLEGDTRRKRGESQQKEHTSHLTWFKPKKKGRQSAGRIPRIPRLWLQTEYVTEQRTSLITRFKTSYAQVTKRAHNRKLSLPHPLDSILQLLHSSTSSLSSRASDGTGSWSSGANGPCC